MSNHSLVNMEYLAPTLADQIVVFGAPIFSIVVLLGYWIYSREHKKKSRKWDSINKPEIE